MNSKTYLKAYFILGLFFISSWAYAQDQNIADSLITVLESTPDTLNTKLKILTRIAEESTNPNDKLYYSNEIIQLATNRNSHLWLLRGFLQKGEAMRLKGDFDTALAAYFKSAEAAQKADYPAGIGAALLSIGDTYDMNGDHINSIKYTNQAIAVLRQTTDSTTLAAALMNTGYGYYLTQEYDSALIYYDESAHIYQNINYLLGIAYNLGNSGLVYAKIGHFSKAEVQLNQAISILEEMEDSYAITEFQIEIADILIQKEQYTQAEKYLIETLAYAQKYGLQERLRDASLKLATLYEKQQVYQKAYDYHKQYLSYRDSINNESTIREMADLRTEFEVGQKQVELDLEAAKVQILEEKDFYAEVRFWSLMALAVLFMGVYALGMKLYRSRMTALRLADKRFHIIKKQREALDEMNNLKDQFFSIISHDLRGPMSNLTGVTDLMEIYINEKNYDALLGINNLLRDSSHEVTDLLENLLNWAVAQQNNIQYNTKAITIQQLCHSPLRISKFAADKKKIKLNTTIQPDLSVLADENTLNTVVRNLLSNAIKFTKSEGTITLSTHVQDGMGVIAIKDDGIGIPADKIDSLFTFTGGRKRWGTDGETGVGLGLNLVKEFVEKNNGRIEVISEEGVGSEFLVYLPLAE
ncbi:MAG: tetratricopeptide repeat-containing sensor histidine kinase [Reichenbachiella sp.]